jgi:hypothetical protein
MLSTILDSSLSATLGACNFLLFLLVAITIFI